MCVIIIRAYDVMKICTFLIVLIDCLLIDCARINQSFSIVYLESIK